MIWTAALSFEASPQPAPNEPACGGTVLQAQRSMAPAAAASSLEDMSILLFEANRLGGGAAARSRGRRGDGFWRRRVGRWDARCARGGGHARVGAPKQKQVAFVRWAGAVGRHFQRIGRNRPHQARRDDNDQLGLVALEV